MPLIPVDVTTANIIPSGNYKAIVRGLTYQIKTGEKWNKDGTTEVMFEEWLKHPLDLRRVHLILLIAEKGLLFHQLYMVETAAGFMAAFLRATKVPITKEGFDIELSIEKEVGVDVGIIDDPAYEPRNVINKFFKV